MMAKIAGATAAVLVSTQVITPSISPQAVTFPSAIVGDYAFIYCPYQGGSPTGGAGGWTPDNLVWTNYGYQSNVYRKVLAAGDLAGVSISAVSNASSIIVEVYRNVIAAALVASNPGETGATLTLAGFTKNVASKGLVSFSADRDGPGTSPTAPTGFTARSGPGTSLFFAVNSASLLVPANYVNGASVIWTGYASGFDQCGFLYEMT